MGSTMRIVYSILTLFSLGSCGTSGEVAEPDRTSFPRSRVVHEDIKMWVAPGVKVESTTTVLERSEGKALYRSSGESVNTVTYDFARSVVGDSATKELYITPSLGRGSSESALLAEVPSRGAKACDGAFRTLSTKYFVGNEATVGMLGLAGAPSLRAVYRCSVYRGSSSIAGEPALRAFAQGVNDLDFFDALEKTYDIPLDALTAAVSQSVERNGMAIIRTQRQGDMVFILASRDPRSGGSNQLVVSIRSNGDSSTLTLIAPVFETAVHSYSVFSGVQDKHMGRVPADRNFAYLHAKRMLGIIERSV